MTATERGVELRARADAFLLCAPLTASITISTYAQAMVGAAALCSVD